MRKLTALLTVVLFVCQFGWAQQPETKTNETEQLRQQVEQLKQALAQLEQRLDAQEKKTEEAAKTPPAAPAATPTDKKLEAKVGDLDRRMNRAERDIGLNRIHFSGDYRFEAHSITGHIPTYYNGMALQSNMVEAMFYSQATGTMPSSVSQINGYVATHYGDFQYFSNNLTFAQLKQGFGAMPAAQQQALMGMLMPSTLVKGYDYKNAVMYTNRLRLNFDAQMADNLRFVGRLSMYKVFGDSTGVQVFNGQPSSLNIDGTTATVPNSDILRVERAFFTWSKIGGLPVYLSIGRRPSTDGPPMNIRQDEPRGGTPMGSLIDYQFDGITIGYHVTSKTEFRACYGVGYESGFGSGDVTQLPQDRLSDTHLIGGNFDIWNTDKTLIQATIAKAFDVTDGFDGLVVMPSNPVTGQAMPNFVMRYSPSANLGDIDLAGFLVQRRQGPFDLFGNINWVGLRPNSLTTPFGGLGTDPFETPTNHDGNMVYAGVRYNFSNDKTKAGFEYNHGSKYWFNFAQAQDDIISPKTSTRGNVYEAYLTHRINRRFMFKADYIHYDYNWSGSGWHVGAPKALNSSPVLGFPTYDTANMFTIGLTTRF